MSELRLHVYLAHAGVASRRACEELIRQGRVAVDGVVVTALGTRIDPGRQRVTVNGKPVRAPREHVCWMLHKPPGVTTTCQDRHAERTVIDLARSVTGNERLYPVGRLDKNSTGLVLLTNDGTLAFAIMHPSCRIEKEYELELRGPWNEQCAAAWINGVELEDGPTAPVRLVVEDCGPGRAQLRVWLHEGRKRQLRRMAEAVRCKVVRLHRVAIGPLRLGALPVGECRRLTDDEQRALRAAVFGKR